MTMNTDLQQSRQNQAGIANLDAVHGANIAPGGGNNTPNALRTQDIYEQMLEAKSNYPIVNPPSEEEIQKTMWTSSFVVGLLGALVSGNASGGIACGMSAALAIHDHGFDLRQRAGFVHELHEKGFSAPAILSWYKTGDNKELDKESAAMEKKREFDLGRQDKNEQFAATEHDKLLDRNQRAELQREQLGEQMAIARLHEAAANARAVEANKHADAASGVSMLGHLNSLSQGLYRPEKEVVSNLNNKQNYIDQVKTAINQMRSGNPVAYNALLTGLAGMDNPNAVPKEGAIERLDEIGGLSQQMRNSLEKAKNGVFTADTIQQIQDFAAAHQADINKQRQAVYNRAYSTASNYLAPIAGEHTPAYANAVAQQVSAGAVQDDAYAGAAPALMSQGQQEQQASRQQGSTTATGGPDAHNDSSNNATQHTSAGGVTFTVSK